MNENEEALTTYTKLFYNNPWDKLFEAADEIKKQEEDIFSCT